MQVGAEQHPEGHGRFEERADRRAFADLDAGVQDRGEAASAEPADERQRRRRQPLPDQTAGDRRPADDAQARRGVQPHPVVPLRDRPGHPNAADEEEDDQGDQPSLGLADLEDTRADPACRVAQRHADDERGDGCICAVTPPIPQSSLQLRIRRPFAYTSVRAPGSPPQQRRPAPAPRCGSGARVHESDVRSPPRSAAASVLTTHTSPAVACDPPLVASSTRGFVAAPAAATAQAILPRFGFTGRKDQRMHNPSSPTRPLWLRVTGALVSTSVFSFTFIDIDIEINVPLPPSTQHAAVLGLRGAALGWLSAWIRRIGPDLTAPVTTLVYLGGAAAFTSTLVDLVTPPPSDISLTFVGMTWIYVIHVPFAFLECVLNAIPTKRDGDRR